MTHKQPVLHDRLCSLASQETSRSKALQAGSSLSWLLKKLKRHELCLGKTAEDLEGSWFLRMI